MRSGRDTEYMPSETTEQLSVIAFNNDLNHVLSE